MHMVTIWFELLNTVVETVQILISFRNACDDLSLNRGRLLDLGVEIKLYIYYKLKKLSVSFFSLQLKKKT